MRSGRSGDVFMDCGRGTSSARPRRARKWHTWTPSGPSTGWPPAELSLAGLLSTGLLVVLASPLWSAIFTLKNGVQVEGVPGKIASLGRDLTPEGIGGGEIQNKLIEFADDGMRRVFFSAYMRRSVVPSPPQNLEKIEVRQNVARNGTQVVSFGNIRRITPFDEYGRRVLSMNTAAGPIDVIQGMTEATPTYCKVEGLITNRSPYVCEMRIATSSVPREILSPILLRQVDSQSVDDRWRIVRFYIQAERYQDAVVELEQAIRDFPDEEKLKAPAQALYQQLADRLIQEIELRREAGQHQRVYSWLQNFPVKGVAGEKLLQVRDLLAEYDEQLQKRERVFSLLDQHRQGLPDEALRQRLQPVLDEIHRDLSVNTLSRMADYLRLADDQELKADQKLSLAVSGWLLGSGQGTENLAVAASLYEVRELVVEYLNAALPQEREQALERLAEKEGGTPSYLARILANMRPPKPTSPQENLPPGMLELAVPGAGADSEFRYLVQLPPNYDPYRRYPCIVTLHGGGTSAEQQVDWWAGGFDDQTRQRMGQATRRGYIVLAPRWAKPFQASYEYSFREHAAVIYSLRDACQRLAIDTDRVYLSGHSMGGEAAWDLGLSHPDLWAGVIPVAAACDKYITRYWENARHTNFYFVGGERDPGKMEVNAAQFNRYLTHIGYNTMIVDYRGRGHEHFHDEIQYLFQWMERHRRTFFPDQFSCHSMRRWDNYFWWAELDDFPERTLTEPLEWPKPRARTAQTEGTIQRDLNLVKLQTDAGRAVVWLSPEMVDFQKRVRVLINNRPAEGEAVPSPEVLLEDVRTRGDRQHPFWAKVSR